MLNEESRNDINFFNSNNVFRVEQKKKQSNTQLNYQSPLRGFIQPEQIIVTKFQNVKI